MKRWCILCLIAVVTLSWSADYHSAAVALDEAVRTGLIRVSATHDPDSPHYKYPLKVSVSNIGKSPVHVDIYPGLLFEAEDETYQGLLVTEQKRLAIAPGKTEEFALAAKCIHSARAAGSNQTIYKTPVKSDTLLVRLAELIAQKQWQNSEAQQAVWVLANKEPYENIYGPDTVTVLALQQAVAGLQKKPLPERILPQPYAYNYYAGNMEIEITGYFEYKLSSAREIEIALFNDRGVLTRELLRKHVSSPGKHRFDYTLDGAAFEEDKYYVRLIMDGRIMLSRALPLGELRESWR